MRLLIDNALSPALADLLRNYKSGPPRDGVGTRADRLRKRADNSSWTRTYAWGRMACSWRIERSPILGRLSRTSREPTSPRSRRAALLQDASGWDCGLPSLALLPEA